MTVGVPQYSVATVQSLYYFLNHTSYASSGAGFYTPGTLKDKYSGLDIILGYPHTLEDIDLPTLALIQDLATQEEETFGMCRVERILPFHIDGFAGGQQSEERNKLLRDQLRDEVRYLLSDTDYIDFYNVNSEGKIDTSTVVSDIEVLNIRDENLPVTGPLAVDRYRFRISFDVSFTRDASE
jgi:hypothetical protein